MRKILLIDSASETPKSIIDEFGQQKKVEFKIVDSAREALDFMTVNGIEKFSLIILMSKLQELTVNEFVDTAKLTLKQKLPPILINSTQFPPLTVEPEESRNVISMPLGNKNLTDVMTEFLSSRS